MSRSNELRVFISSTFRDLQEEREHLVKKIFPEIRSLCRERGIRFTEIDLRWGLTEEEGTLGRVIRTCLEEIDRCQPYFIGITGERYGYIPELHEIYKDPVLLREYPWIEDSVTDRISIIEMEFRHAALSLDGSGASMAVDDRRARFYFRRSRARLGYDGVVSDRWTRQESDEDRQRLESLKERMRDTGLPVGEFRDPVTLGEMIYDDLVAIIARDFAEVRPPSELERERSAHEAFAASRCYAYIPNAEYITILNKHAAGDGAPLVIYAESGSGKSALVAYWAQQYRRRHPDAHVVEHYVGIGAGATDHIGIMRHVMAEIKERFDRDEELPSTPEEIEKSFANWLGFTDLRCANSENPFVLILDGLNQLQGKALNLAWLPQHIPSNIRLVVTSTIEQTLVALRERGWQEMGVQPLTIVECEAAIVRYLAENHKSLNVDQVRRIAEDRKSGSPLFLRTLLEEMRLYGSHEHLERRIDYLLKTTGTEDLFQRVLERLEEDHGTRVVREVMRLLWGSRSGLSELELAELTDVSRMRLSTLVLALDYHLVRRDGLLSFFHDYLRRAVEKRYLTEDAQRREVHLELAGYFDRQGASQRTSRELLWQLHTAGENERLAVALSTISHFMALSEGETKYEVLAYWKQLTDAGYDADECYRRSLAERRQQASGEWAAELEFVAGLRRR
jgi:nephrocystin-3